MCLATDGACLCQAQEFGTPHQVDRDIVAAAYPWLKGYDNGEPGRLVLEGGMLLGCR